MATENQTYKIDVEELNATLLRRIAHAVDGYRSGELVYLVLDAQVPYRVTRMLPFRGGDMADFEERLERDCQRLQRDAGPPDQARERYRWAGPYKTFKEEDPPLIMECHEFDSDWCEEGEVTNATMNLRASELPKDTDVTEITVSWKTVKGDADGKKIFRWGDAPELYLDDREDSKDVVPHMVDAIFFTQAAADKFLYPYIARVHGVKTAFEQRGRTRIGQQKILAEIENRKKRGLNAPTPRERRVDKSYRSGLVAGIVEGSPPTSSEIMNRAPTVAALG